MLINGRFLTRPATGVDRFALELIRALDDSGGLAGARAVVPARSTVASPWPTSTAIERAGRYQGHAWEQLELSRAAGDQPLVNLCNTAPLARENQLVVLHDAAAVANPSNYSLAFRSWYRVMLTGLMRRSRVIATVSKFSADELARYFGVRAAGIEVIPESGEHILREPADRSVIDRLGLADRPYVLAVGSQSANKNFAAVVAAMEQLGRPDVLLVAAGGANNRVFSSTAPDASRMLSTGYVSDAQLRALYEHAACFVFPSFYEGPTLVSMRASLPEVCGDATLYFDPADPSTLAAQLRRLLDSASLREELRQAGHARAAMYTWQRAAHTFSQIMQTRFH
jgi:glycosyltransferase involved in cell wall biosynthesis